MSSSSATACDDCKRATDTQPEFLGPAPLTPRASGRSQALACSARMARFRGPSASGTSLPWTSRSGTRASPRAGQGPSRANGLECICRVGRPAEAPVIPNEWSVAEAVGRLEAARG